jgi:fructose-bisphosphate aldolase class I
MDVEQRDRVGSGRGFFAALDQSGGSTPKALGEYGIGPDRYSGDREMYDLVHRMRTRIVTDPAFDGTRVLGAILFEQTMDRDVDGIPAARYLWERKQVVPFLKVDKGLAEEKDGVQLMKPIDTLDELLERAGRQPVLGTKMRSLIKDADSAGVAAIVDQQLEYARRIAAAGFVPILEPEVDIHSATKDAAEALLRDALQAGIEALPAETTLMLKLSIPTEPGRYAELAADPRVLRVLALSGGWDRDEACRRLARDPSMIASFSRALLQGLSADQSDKEFSAALDAAIEQIYRASVHEDAR